MSYPCSVVRVMPWAPSQGEFVEINAGDFDPAKHKRWPAAPVAPPVLPAPAPAAPVVPAK